MLEKKCRIPDMDKKEGGAGNGHLKEQNALDVKAAGQRGWQVELFGSNGDGRASSGRALMLGEIWVKKTARGQTQMGRRGGHVQLWEIIENIGIF
jgi:hypothetical protein